MSSEEEGTPDWILGSGSSVSPNRNLKFVPYENIQVNDVDLSVCVKSVNLFIIAVHMYSLCVYFRFLIFFSNFSN